VPPIRLGLVAQPAGLTGVGLGNGKEDYAVLIGKISYVDIFTLFVLQNVRW
jgi:hypothetical protein